MNSSARYFHLGASSSLIALILLCLAWELVLAPLRPGGSWMVLKVVPLLLPLRGVLKRDVYTLQWSSMLILVYLAEKTGRFLPADLRGRSATLQWLMWQMGNLGPMAGQNGHFHMAAPEKIPYAIERYVKETARLYGVLNKQLEGREYIAGDYSIADMACYPWVVPHKMHEQKLEDFPHLQRWFNTVQARPAVQRAYALVQQVNPPRELSTEEKEAQRKVLYGQNPGGQTGSGPAAVK